MLNVLAQNEDFINLADTALINNESPANEGNIGMEINSNSELINTSSLTATYAAVTVTTQQLIDLYESGPLDIIASPGEGYINVLHGLGFSIEEGGTEFNEDFQYQLMSVVYNSGSRPILAFSMGSFFLDYTEDRFTYANVNMINVDHAYVYNSECVNKAISLYPSGTFTATGGTTMLRVHVWYTTIEANF